MTGFSDGADPRGKFRCLQNTAVEFTEVIEPSGSIVSGVIATLTRFQTSVTVSGFRTLKVHGGVH